MTDIKCKVLVIGAGPGGYVCAIRAGQLGLDTVVVDEARAGGTCLNIGCIPSKAMIHAADEFYKMTHAATGPLGISASAPIIDLKQTVAWKDGIVERLTGGVGGLLRKAGVKMVSGRARFVDGKTVVVKGADGKHLNYVLTYSDVNEIKNVQRKFEFLATHDELTRLPNRNVLMERLELMLGNARRQEQLCAVLFFDLDDFKKYKIKLGNWN